MQQMTLAAGTFEPYRKATRREIFLSEMDRVVPWKESRHQRRGRPDQDGQPAWGDCRPTTDLPAGIEQRPPVHSCP